MRQKSEKGRTGLMLVEDPIDTLQAMCKFKKKTLDLKSFKSVYEKIKKRNIPIHIKNLHTHFYTLSVYGFIKPHKSGTKGEYVLSKTGNEICECFAISDKKTLRKILSTILLNNQRKGPLFKRFINFVNKKKKIKKTEIFLEFKELPGRTLIAWSEAAGLIEKDDKFIWGTAQNRKKSLTLDEFKEELVKNYIKMNKSEMLGIERIFVEIQEIRQTMCINNSWLFEEFDEKLRKLLHKNPNRTSKRRDHCL